MKEMLVVRKTKRYMTFLSLVLVFVVILSTEARAVMYDFECITNTSATNAAIGEAQLSVDVTDPGSDQVLFTFYNTAVLSSSITDIYVDDGALLANPIDSLVGSSGVIFSALASPGNLPGGGGIIPKFVTSTGLSADSDPDVFANGVNASGEYLKVWFDLNSGITFANVITAINRGFHPESWYDYDNKIWKEDHLLVGIHVQGFDGGGSESFVMTPVPGAVILGILGLGVAGIKLRKYA